MSLTRASVLIAALLAGQACAVRLRRAAGRDGSEVTPRSDLGLKGFQDGPVVATKLDYDAMVYDRPYVSHQNGGRRAKKYMYVGCTFDIQDKQQRWYHKEVPKEDRQPMTPDVCWDFCHRIPGTQYFGLQNGDRCYCTPFFTESLKDVANEEGRKETNAFWTGGPKHSDRDLRPSLAQAPAEPRGHSTYASTGGHFKGMCDMPCVGHPTEMCGGQDLQSVYNLVFCEGDGTSPSTTGPGPGPDPTVGPDGTTTPGPDGTTTIGPDGTTTPPPGTTTATAYPPTTTTTADPCLDYGAVEFDFFHAYLKHNNLGGQGPRSGDPAEMRYAQIGTANGREFDIVITTRSLYSGSVGANGYPSGGEITKFGTINVAPNTDVQLTFSFRDSETNEPVEVPGFYFSFFDIDGDKSGKMKEAVEVFGYKEYALSEGSEVAVISDYPGHKEFHSTAEGYFCDNPRDPMKLGEVSCPGKPEEGGQWHPKDWKCDQRKRGVTFTFEKASSFDARLAVICTKDKCSSRNFLFAGRSYLVSHCPSTSTPKPPPGPCLEGGPAVDWRLDFFQANLVYNNLGGQGPNKEDPAEIRYGRVGVMNGREFDLKLTTPTSDYVAAKITSNGFGQNGKFGNVNVLGGVALDLKFTWVYTGTDEEVKLPRFYFSFFDLDQSKGFRMRETLDVDPALFTEYVVDPNTDIKVMDAPDGKKRFKSTMFGDGCDNPKDPLQLGEIECGGNPMVDMKKRSVMFTFEGDISSFTVHYDVSCTDKKGNPTTCSSGRNLLFAGESSMTDLCQ